jgi:hypothetical protein
LIIEFLDKNIVKTHIWRRGSAPVIWKTVTNGMISSLEITKEFASLTQTYFARLNEKFNIPILCVNLLKSSEENEEKSLCDAYSSSIKKIKPKITYLEFDWHSLSKTISLEFVIITFWGHLKTKVGCDIFQEFHG